MPSALDRRQFLQLAGASALAGLIPTQASAITGPSLVPGRIRVAVLLESGFPAVDVPAPDVAMLGAALDGLAVVYLSASEVSGALSAEGYDVLVTPYGSAFPVEAWLALRRYLDGGGNWVNVGGVPCAVPVERAAGGGWRALPRADTYHRQLGITLACPVGTGAVREWRANDALPWASVLAAGLVADTVWEAYWRLSSVADTPDESGSAGPREAVVRPLVSGLDAAGRAVVAPLVQVDRLEREFAGGRWILATGDGALAPATLRALVEAASGGARELIVRPSAACCRGGERPSVSVTLRGLPRGAASLAATCDIGVFDSAGAALRRVSVAVGGTEAVARGSAELVPGLPDPLAPGLYRLEAALTVPGARSEELRHTTGFWVWDEKLLAAGAPLRAGPHGLTRGGEPFPVTGTTYMASDVHRKFLLEPNPWLWDRDFVAMRRAGVNLVRTGIWTGWKVLMPRVGAFDEEALRALDAYLLTARRHDAPVVFTLFAFLPETWGGENPYLDPAAVAAQRAFLSVLARRYAGMHDLMWDLINEPSFCNKDHLWSCRPNYDRFERAAWAAWLGERHPDRPAVDLPALEDFDEGAGAVDRPAVLEYRRFAQEMFGRWVREMRAVLRGAAGSRQLVTVGQDEAGTRDSPNNLFLAPELDFTCVHTWWLNDALVWDEVLTRAPGRANLVEETGVMFAAHPPGVEARWEEYARNLLERKMAVALGPGGAGFVEWVWNANCYMPSDNEAAIGLLRADGTAKPELEALRGVAAFVAEARRHLRDREDEPVLLVVPHSNMFSTSNTATAATRRAVRAMQYGCRVGLAAVSEFTAAAALRAPRLVLVPSPRVLRPEAWDAIRTWARRGATVLVTGPLEALAGSGTRPAVGPSAAVRLPLGRGEILWSPESVELASDDAATVELYRWALGRARVAPAFTVDGADPSILVHAAAYRDAVLFTVVSERAEPAALRLRHGGAARALEVALPGERAALLLVRRSDGRLIARYQPA